LLIPDGDAPPVAATVEPLPLELAAPNCYPLVSGGTWCFLSLYNGTGEDVESVAASIRLHDEQGHLVAEKTAFLPLDRLPAETRGALFVYFPEISTEVTAYAHLLSALPAPEGTQYPPVSLQNVFTEIAWDGKSAEVQGKAVVSGEFSRLWVLASAYDAEGNLVGVRRWESAVGESEFHLTVASLGHAIETVLLSAEAKR